MKKKYISGKSIDSVKANKVQDLIGMGKTLWEFINVVYESQWDALLVENNFSIMKNSEEESRFIEEATCAIKIINDDDLTNSFKLDETIISLASRIDHTRKANSK